MAYPVPQGYGTAAGSHVWQASGVQAEGAHMEASCPLANNSYRSAEFLGFPLMTIFFTLMQLLVFCAALAVLGAMEWQNKLVTRSLALHLQNDQAEP